MAKKNEKNELTVALDNYPILDPESNAAEMLAINLEGEDIGAGDLQRIKVPSGGSTIWEVQSATGVNALTELEGVIIHVKRQRSYWESNVPSGDKPDCHSDNMAVGKGDPGGECASCPFNEYESAHNGKGKACKEQAVTFLLREGRVLPDVVSYPPASLKAFRQYRLALSSDSVPYYGVVSRLTLKPEKTDEGTGYASIVTECVGLLSPEQTTAISAYVAKMTEVFSRTKGE